MRTLLVVFAIIIAAIIFAPLMIIMSVNTLFGMDISFNLQSWLSTWILVAVINANITLKMIGIAD